MARLSCLAAVLMSVVAPAALAQRPPLRMDSYLAENYAIMLDYGRCSAFYAHQAQMHELAGPSVYAEELRSRAREAKAVADAGTGASEKGPAFLESIMALETARQRALAERREIDIEQMLFCARKRTQ